MEAKFYKIEDLENGYSKYIQETEEQTVTIAFGAIEPKIESHNGKYKRLPGELILPCTEDEYREKFELYSSDKENFHEPVTKY